MVDGNDVLEPNHLLPKDFFDQLQALYEKKNRQSEWRDEGPQLRDIIDKIAHEISSTYKFRSPINLGGGGVVARVTDTTMGVDRALKLPRPSSHIARRLADIIKIEREHIRSLSHPNIIELYSQGEIKANEREIPFYIMALVDVDENNAELDQFLMNAALHEVKPISIFMQIVGVIDYMHKHNKIHMDIKPSNILVTKNGLPIVMDLGLTRNIRLSDTLVPISGTEGYMHPEARSYITQISQDPNRIRGEAPERAFKTEWDLYSLGKTFLNLLAVIQQRNPDLLSAYERRYLRLIASRLLDGYNITEDERALGLPKSIFREIKYSSAEAALVDLEKLSGSYNLGARIPELKSIISDTIQASTLAPTPFTPRVKKIAEHPLMSRLGRVSQLGLLNFVYPGATHSRLEHSLGVFAALSRYLVALYEDQLNPLFKQIMNEDDLTAALIAGLMHDVGYYPLAHDIEEADPLMKDHDQVGLEALEAGPGSLHELIEGKSDDSWGISITKVTNILKARPARLQGDIKSRILHALLDGPVDADKIDYLVRDSIRLGVPFGRIIDFERLLRCLTIVHEKLGGGDDADVLVDLGIHEKGRVIAETIAFARYTMYAQVYWHHKYRAFKAMLHRLLWECLQASGANVNTFRNDFVKFAAEEAGLGIVANDAVPINAADRAVLNWLSTRGGPQATVLFKMISSGIFFKRLLVISFDRQHEHQNNLWDDVVRYWDNNKNEWERKLTLQRAMQDQVVMLVRHLVGPLRDHFLHQANHEPLILVDVPPDRSSSSVGGGFRYLMEEDRFQYKSDKVVVGRLEHSLVLSAIQANFRRAIGKVRLFAHPDYRDFLRISIPRTQMERALRLALEQVTSAKTT